MKSVIRLWWPVILFAMFIFIMSSISSPSGEEPFPYADKVVHFMVYGAFSLFIFRCLTRTIGNNRFMLIAVFTVVIAIAYGMSDEFHQSFVPTRDPDIKDVAADGIGAFTAMTVLYFWSRARQRLSD